MDDIAEKTSQSIREKAESDVADAIIPSFLLAFPEQFERTVDIVVAHRTGSGSDKS